MKGRSSIVDKLILIQRRLYHEQLIYNCTCYGIYGLTVIGIVLMVNRFIYLPIILLIVLIVLLTGALIVIASQKLDLLQVAKIADGRLKLKDRLSTAVGITRKKKHLGFDSAQLCDAANEAKKIVLSSHFPLKVPVLWKLTPIPIILICLSFLITERHNQPELPTTIEKQAINQTVNRLENLIDTIDENQLKTDIQETINKLKEEQITSQQAQASLSQLRYNTHRQKQQIQTNQLRETQKAIYKVTKMPMGNSASNFDKLADQFDGLDAKQVTELKRKLQQIARALGKNHIIGESEIKDDFSDLHSEVVSAEKLKRMAKALLNLDRQLQHLTTMEETLNQIREGRKRIALAGIEMNRNSSSIADSSGNPGQESGTGDTQGVTTQGDNSIWTPNKQNSATREGISMSTPAQLDRDPILPNHTNDIDLKLNNISSDYQGLSQVFVSQDSDSSIEPEYVSFQQAHLNAKQNYAEAIQRDSIPVRYQQQISDYLNAIAEIDAP